MHNPCSMVVSHFGEDLPFPDNFFDRVLCDVPCSGDGTIRKSPNMKWRSARSVPLHCIQVGPLTILTRLLSVNPLVNLHCVQVAPLTILTRLLSVNPLVNSLVLLIHHLFGR